ncbi:hypothetical protein CCP4SC76_570003 [Gammaproteobacteria bacterium]
MNRHPDVKRGGRTKRVDIPMEHRRALRLPALPAHRGARRGNKKAAVRNLRLFAAPKRDVKPGRPNRGDLGMVARGGAGVKIYFLCIQKSIAFFVF